MGKNISRKMRIAMWSLQKWVLSRGGVEVSRGGVEVVVHTKHFLHKIVVRIKHFCNFAARVYGVGCMV